MSKHAQSNRVADRSPAVSVFGVYDSDASKRRVEALLERVAGSLSGNFQLTTILRRCDVLGRAPLGDKFKVHAAGADIMLVALEAGARLQNELIGWLEKWAANRKVADAALALFTGGAVPTSLPTVESLRPLAERHGLTLLLSSDAVASHARETTHQRAQQQKRIAPSITNVTEDVQRWDHSGLNE